jgi:ATP-dependent DNA ligase
MAPTLVREPLHREGWVYEEKVDGWRIVAYKDGPRVHLLSRNGVDHTRRFGDLAAAVAKLSARTAVLDGEVAIFDERYARASSGFGNRTRRPSRRRRSSWCSTYSIETVVT